MALQTLALAPDQSGYSADDGTEVLSVKLDGGLSRYRRDVLGAASSVRVKWTIGPTEYTYLRAFYRTSTARGSDPFLLDLMLDSPLLSRHEAYFVPGSMRLTNVSGLTYTVEAQLEVKPLPPDSEFDEALVELYGLYGQQTGAFLLDLEYFVNHYMPSVIGP